MLNKIAEPYLIAIENELKSILTSTLHDEPEFGLMLRYAMGWETETGAPYNQPTGKRLRPLLLLLSAEAAGDGNWQPALPAAAAVEFLHNFSLIHDDIQDVSDIRHGRPTVWKVWGQANAINAGDAMFTTAYSALQRLPISAETRMAIWEIFNTTNIELTRGQHLDMRFEKQQDVTIDEYISMIKGKSAALLSACTTIGALIGGQEHRAVHYAHFGINLGIAFQIRDDILGIWGDPDVTGKSTATDILTKKKSLPVLFGLMNNKNLKKVYQRPEFNTNDVEEAVKLLDECGAQTYARTLEVEYYDRAMEALALGQPTVAGRAKLQVLVDFLFNRSH